MNPRSILPVCLSLLAAMLILASAAFAQEANARISGIITDPSKAVVTGVDVVAVNVETGIRFLTKTNGSGVYVLPGLPIGDYRVEVVHTGFKSIVEPGIVLHTQDALELNFEMALGSASETVTVNGSTTNDSPAVSMTVDREFVENMPLNGQSFQDLIQLAPGTVDGVSNGAAQGYYSVNGQRTDSNNFTVDGVSSNLGGVNNTGTYGTIGPGLAGAVPAQTALGTTQSLASVDSLEEFKIQTSGYTAESGRNPGGQVQLTTRSGTNDLHGTLFDYLRNTAFDANSYFDDFTHVKQTAEHQNDFGGTLGGPLTFPRFYNGRDKTFYFLSYEGLRLLLPNSESEFVPTQTFDNAASSSVRPFLDVAPMPNTSTAGDSCTVSGTTINPTGLANPSGTNTPCDEQFNYGYSYPNNLDNYSARLDQNLGKHYRAFARYAYTPSSVVYGAEDTTTTATNVRSLTTGLTDTISTNLLNDVRFNYSSDVESGVTAMRSINGSVPLPRSLAIPSEYEGPYAGTSDYVEIGSTSLFVSPTYSGSGSLLRQLNLVDSVVWTHGEHSFKFGGDWRRLSSNFTSQPYQSNIYFINSPAIQQGVATYVYVTAEAPGIPIFDDLSIYAQDHWRAFKRLSIDYGLRWEFNPPPGPSNGHYPVALTSSNLSTATLAPLGTKPYKTYYDKFAPRFGFAWIAVPSQRHPLTVRGGFGIFFDTAQQTIGASYTSTYPFVAIGTIFQQVQTSQLAADLAPPALNFPLTSPYPYLGELTSPDLTDPYTEQWNISLDEALGGKNTLTLSYVGNNGKKLLFTNSYSEVTGNANFPNGLNVTDNASFSRYNALQVQDGGRLANDLDLVGSFTWSHALDNVSSDFGLSNPVFGNSDFDLRRVLNLALNYSLPTADASHWGGILTHGWTVGNRFSAQSGNALTVEETYAFFSDGTQTLYTPDLVSGVPIYLHGSAANVNGVPVPGNWRLNSAAFSIVPTDPATGNPIRQGTLGRNYVRTPPFWALNTSLQRNIPIYEMVHLDFRVDAFNILNHPNLNRIGNYLPASSFGESNAIAGTIGSSNQLYATGAARSLQFSLKLQF